MRAINGFARRAKPYFEILKLKGSLVDVAVMLGTSAFLDIADWRLPLAVITGALIHSSADVYNDIYDREIDKICKPSAPLSSGRISVKAAWVYLGLLTFIALSVAFYLSQVLFSGYLVGIVSGYVLYSHPVFRLKDVPVVSIGIIALYFSLESLGLWSIYRPLGREAFLVAGYFFILVFSLVFMKDFRDIKGDVNSLPIMLGVKKASLICCVLAILPLGGIVLLAVAFSMIMAGVAAVAYLVLISSCIKVLVFENPVVRGRVLKDRMVLSICIPNIILFLLVTTAD